MHWKCRTIALVFWSVAVVRVDTAVESATHRSTDQQIQIVAEEMCCKGCAQKASGQLYAARGVKEVAIDMKTRTVTVSLPQPSPVILGQLWHAVEQSEGGPTKLATSEATYSLDRAEKEFNSSHPAKSALHIVIENLHCNGCAQKIAAQLYALKGVTKVSVLMQQETLIVQTRPETPISPWLTIEAVARANERPLAVSGTYGTLSLDWTTKIAPKTHAQTQQTTIGGIQI